MAQVSQRGMSYSTERVTYMQIVKLTFIKQNLVAFMLQLPTQRRISPISQVPPVLPRYLLRILLFYVEIYT
jgi:hypothetical protein